MKKKELQYRQDVAFINRQKELNYLTEFIAKRPAEILFLHGPKSSGKTTLLYKFFEQIIKTEKLDIKFLNLREKMIARYQDFIRIFFGLDQSKNKGDVKETREYNIFTLFKLSVETMKGMETGSLDPFSVMKTELIKLNEKGIKPVIIVDEIQALDRIYMNDGPDKELIIELFNFFVAMTKESHLAHVIISSSDGYFINKIYTDSKLKKAAIFYKVDYLGEEDVREWLLNIDKYSKISAYRLTQTEIDQIWDTLGGSVWEIQAILSELFNTPVQEALEQYKRKIKGTIAYYIGLDKKKKAILTLFTRQDKAAIVDFAGLKVPHAEIGELLKDMVRNNILYFEPTEALYSLQGESFRWGLKFFLENL